GRHHHGHRPPADAVPAGISMSAFPFSVLRSRFTALRSTENRERRAAYGERRAGRWLGAALTWAVLGAALLASIGPGLYMLSLSFMDNQQLFGGQVLAWPLHPENYPQAWVATRIGQLYWNSIYVSTGSMLITVAISALAGYGLGR